MASYKSDEPFDWGSLLEQTDNPNEVDIQLLKSLDLKKSDTPNKNEKRQNVNRKKPFLFPRKKRVDSGDHDKNEDKLSRSNIMPIKPSNEVQVRSYIDLLEEFLGDTENIEMSANANVHYLISSIDNFEKSLKTMTVNDNSKEVVLKKLLEIQDIVSLKIKSFDPSYNRTENWVKDQTRVSELNSPRHNLETVETSSNKSNAKSNVSSPSYPFFTSQQEIKAVKCQYCCSRVPDLHQLIKHINYDCQMFRERDFDNSARNDLSYFQILPDDKIKCNICDIKVNNLTLKKEHDRSVHHNKLVEKFKTRDAKKNLTSYIYCSCCKINVPDTYIQFKMHLENPEHIEIKNKKVNLGDLADKGVQIVIMKQNKIKCLACSHVEFPYEKEKFQQHSSEDKHIKNAKRKNMGGAIPILCEICDEYLSVIEIDFHLKSQVHSDNLNLAKNADALVKNQYCVFCNKPFPNLTEMALHQESSCSEIHKIQKLQHKSTEPQKSSISSTNVNDEEDDDKEPFSQEQFYEFFKDKEWVTNAAVLLKQKTDKCDVDLDLSIAKECAEEIKCQKYSIFGSRNSELAFDSSDLNIYCNFFENMLVIVNDRLLQVTAQECFHKLNQSEKFGDVQRSNKEAAPFIQCVHKKSRRNCKIAFKIEMSELESDFFKKCLGQDPRIQQFLLCLKLWLKVHSSYVGEFSSFILIMLGVFFLRSKAAFVLPLPPLDDGISKDLAGGDQPKSLAKEQSNLTVADLFFKFCKFYQDFDFSSWVVFTGFSEPLLKTSFESVLIKKLGKIPDNQFTNRQCLWVVSYLNPNVNIAKDITKKMLNRLVKVCEFTANRLTIS